MLQRWRNIFIEWVVVQAPIPHIYDVVNGQLTSVVVWAGLYMDVGVGLNAKYIIMCRKTVLIPKRRWGIDTFGTSATLSLTIAIFLMEYL